MSRLYQAILLDEVLIIVITDHRFIRLTIHLGCQGLLEILNAKSMAVNSRVRSMVQTLHKAIKAAKLCQKLGFVRHHIVIVFILDQSRFLVRSLVRHVDQLVN